MIKKSKTSKASMIPSVLGVLAAIIAIVAAIFILKPKDKPKEIIEPIDISEIEEVQDVLFDLGGGEIKGLFFSMFPLDNYVEDDFLTYLGLNTRMLETQLSTGQDMLKFLELALSENHALTSIYIGLNMDNSKVVEKVTCGGLTQMFLNTCEWDDRLFEIIMNNPEIQFHIILEYPSMYEIAKLSEIQKLELYKWYYDAAVLFGEETEGSNMTLYLPGTESWLVLNSGNYLENGQPNEDAARFVLGQLICNNKYVFKKTDLYDNILFFDDMLLDAKARKDIAKDAAFVFFGDSVIGNYTDSMSIPEIVGSLTGAYAINCGYGGLSAAGSGGLSAMVDAFINNQYEYVEDGKPIKNGIREFHEMLPQIDEEQIVFFISIGLNDYMVGSPLKSDTSKDTSTYKGAIEYAVDKLRTAYPKSEIILMSPNFLARNDYGKELINGYTMTELVEVVQTLAKDLNLKYIDVYNGLNINEKTHEVYLSDRCHPSELGRYELGKLVYQYLLYWNGPS